jgi:hypothetical protein
MKSVTGGTLILVEGGGREILFMAANTFEPDS